MGATTQREWVRVIAAGFGAGVVGGLALVVGFLVLRLGDAESPWPVLQAAAMPILGGDPLAGELRPAAALLGSALVLLAAGFWGGLFAAVLPDTGPAATLLAGLAWGLAVWLAMTRVVLPGTALAAVATATPLAAQLATHLSFGLATALALLAARRPTGAAGVVSRRAVTP